MANMIQPRTSSLIFNVTCIIIFTACIFHSFRFFSVSSSFLSSSMVSSPSVPPLPSVPSCEGTGGPAAGDLAGWGVLAPVLRVLQVEGGWG